MKSVESIAIELINPLFLFTKIYHMVGKRVTEKYVIKHIVDIVQFYLLIVQFPKEVCGVILQGRVAAAQSLARV